MLTIQRFKDALRDYRDGRQPLRLLQDQAVILVNCCRNPYRYIPEAFDITDADIDWLLQQPEATQEYAELIGGDVFICQTPEDLKQVVGMDMDWASAHDGWPNITDLPVVWDGCNFLAEKSGDPEWAMFLLCTNDSGGPVYYIPRTLWDAARVVEHMAATNAAWNPEDA
jgi:hypothetical protein